MLPFTDGEESFEGGGGGGRGKRGQRGTLLLLMMMMSIISTTFGTPIISEDLAIDSPVVQPWEEYIQHVRPTASNEEQEAAVVGLLQRLLPDRNSEFSVTVDPTIGPAGKDTFIVTSPGVNATVDIKGTSGVAASWGLLHYLKYTCNAHVSWEADQLSLPTSLPHAQINVTSNDKFRYYQNVCTVSYSFAWWNWTRWEREIDWMALNGINIPLAFTGQEAIWQRVYLKLGVTQEELDDHFTGPAFFAWERMGNFRKFGGPLSAAWHNQTLALQHQILKRMREFGMTPILPAFAGHVPAGLARVFPDAKITQLGEWAGFNCSYSCTSLLDPNDPLFKKIGSDFISELTTEFGTDHMYNCDTFNEMSPASSDPAYLKSVGEAVFGAMTAADPNAIWVMQGWLFLSSFWQKPQAQALLTSVPIGRMLVLDLASESAPQYSRLESYFGQPFIFCMLHDYGGVNGLFGNIDRLLQHWVDAKQFPNVSMAGTGLTPEGINQNYVMYDLMNELAWRTQPPNVTSWAASYAGRRYGSTDARLGEAWQLLISSVYNKATHSNHGTYILVMRPNVQRTSDFIWYSVDEVVKAWDLIIEVVQGSGKAITGDVDSQSISKEEEGETYVVIDSKVRVDIKYNNKEEGNWDYDNNCDGVHNVDEIIRELMMVNVDDDDEMVDKVVDNDDDVLDDRDEKDGDDEARDDDDDDDDRDVKDDDDDDDDKDEKDDDDDDDRDEKDDDDEDRDDDDDRDEKDDDDEDRDDDDDDQDEKDDDDEKNRDEKDDDDDKKENRDEKDDHHDDDDNEDDEEEKEKEQESEEKREEEKKKEEEEATKNYVPFSPPQSAALGNPDEQQPINPVATPEERQSPPEFGESDNSVLIPESEQLNEDSEQDDSVFQGQQRSPAEVKLTVTDQATFKHDIVDVTRQILQILGGQIVLRMIHYYNTGNATGVKSDSDTIQMILNDLDQILATSPDFLVGAWTKSAADWATNEQEREQYVYNALNQITIWGPGHNDNILDYALKQWSGVVGNYIAPRWELFGSQLLDSLEKGQPFNQTAFNMDVYDQVEEPFTKKVNASFPSEPSGDVLTMATQLHQKYRPYFNPTFFASLEQQRQLQEPIVELETWPYPPSYVLPDATFRRKKTEPKKERSESKLINILRKEGLERHENSIWNIS